jgi:hypothetical protein
MTSKWIVALASLLSLQYSVLWAYDGPVHREITRRATNDSQLDSILKDQLGMTDGINAKLIKIIADGTTVEFIWQWIAFGSAAEDYGKKGRDDFWTTRAFNHFHDPLKDWDQAGFTSWVNQFYNDAYKRDPVSPILWSLKPGEQAFDENSTGDWSWAKAREYYYTYLTGKDLEGNAVATTDNERKSNFSSCLRALGQVMHLLQDVSVPLHTRNDLHIFPINLIPDTRIYLGKWNYETYTKEYLEELKAGETFVAYHPNPILLSDPHPQSNPSDYSHLPPVTGLFDRNQYNMGDSIPPDNNLIGLAEYSNAEFVTEDTMWEYQHPSLADTSYADINWLEPEWFDARDGKRDGRVYIRKTVGEWIEHFAVVDYWSREYQGYENQIPHAYSLDEQCFKDYADKLIPRAVGYSAAILDYFFRGTLEITAPDSFLYSIIDGSILPQKFTRIKAKLKNTTLKEKNEQGEPISFEQMGPGTLVAVAKYKKRTDYQPDLSSDPPTAASREANFSYSVSAPINIDLLSTDTPTEFTFDFADDPIPAGITDLYLQVVFKGTLGNEQNDAIAVGMKDLNEPMHVVSWNSTDRFYLYGQLYTAQQIRANQELLDLIPPGFNIDPYDSLETGAAFYLGDEPEYYDAYCDGLPSGRFTRIIILTDTSSFNMFGSFFSASPPKDTYFEESVQGVVNQEDEAGNFNAAPVFTYRGEKAHLYNVLWNFYPDNAGIDLAPWPSAANPNPVPTYLYP